ncbi:hypothetical protein SLITO_v1c02320 [Spiroplasma litorale]|uniref:Uncharacterized protein n=1 Tax=Spiroplasma litorale TaxID=216942 RepID=A0A0K1W126_9MOLU|nr:hypothetical protein [Spiroplasma litorale]AKX33891.1 hypothetical protein SLITO_v1c02320 [Spiroplasma litorale]
MDTSKKEIYKYKPKDPSDPKMPSLNKDDFNYDNNLQTIELTGSMSYETTKIGSDELKNDSKINVVEKDIDLNDKDNADLFKNISSAKSLINSLKQKANKALEEKTDSDDNKSKVVMPDPNSELNIVNHLRNRGSVSNKLLHQDTRTKMRTLREDHRLNLTENEIKIIKSEFKEKVIKSSKTGVVLKESKFGFEIYKNNIDKRFWVVTVCFDELFDPSKVRFTNLWVGGAFIGYGYDYIEDAISKAKNLATSGRTGNIYWRDFVVDWIKDKNRFVTSDEPKKFTYEEYKKIVDWYSKNKVRICVKNQNKKDYEDLMDEAKQKRAKGERVSPLIALQAKMIDKPRKAVNIYGYPTKNPKYKGKEYEKPENKLYEIGFSYTE